MEKAEGSTEKKVLDPKELHRETAKTILQEGIDFYVEYDKQGWLRKKGILLSRRHFYIRPLVAGTMIRISNIMVDMGFAEEVKKEEFISKGLELMAKDLELLVEIVALAITNTETKPSKGLKKFIRRNVNAEELLALITYVIRQIDVSSFMSTIILIKGMSLLNKRS